MKKMKVKIFKSNQGFDELEKQMNIFLESGVKVTFVTFQDNASYCSALIVYEG